MFESRPDIAFDGRIVMLGFGSIGQTVLPLLLRHIAMRADRIEVVKPSDRGLDAVREFGARHVTAEVDRANYRQVLGARLGAGDVLVNLSINVSSKALVELCRERGALYIDASTEPWPGTYTDRSLAPAQRTNYELREAVLALRGTGANDPTALITLGANPGLVSFFVKQALLDLAGAGTPAPTARDGWARLAQRVGVRVIHIAERDSQTDVRARKAPGEFVNTWSVDAFVGEALQPAELGWGTHERQLPADGAAHMSGCRAAIYLNRPGAATQVRSWAPLAGPFHGFLVTHAESISIADHLTVGDPHWPAYRPTVHYAYHPCDDAVLSLRELAAGGWRLQPRKRMIRDEIAPGGRDELGVLLMGHARGAYWYGSQLTIDEARRLCPYSSATSLQVAAPIVAGVVWALRHPRCGILEPDELPFDAMLHAVRPYLGPVVGVYSDWTPLQDRGRLFDEPLERGDPWQFANFRVT
jgi:homospermidine synthase